MKRLGLAPPCSCWPGRRSLAQKPPAAGRSTEADSALLREVEVSVTNVEVVVTDSKGNRVSGLTREDFEVYQDGLPQKITNFYAVSGGKVLLDDGKVVGLDSPAAQTESRRS